MECILILILTSKLWEINFCSFFFARTFLHNNSGKYEQICCSSIRLCMHAHSTVTVFLTCAGHFQLFLARYFKWSYNGHAMACKTQKILNYPIYLRFIDIQIFSICTHSGYISYADQYLKKKKKQIVLLPGGWSKRKSEAVPSVCPSVHHIFTATSNINYSVIF